jgi:hypothetical protein
MQNINYPLDYVTLNDIVMQNDYVMYLDFAESFHEMLDGELIMEECKSEAGDPMYIVTDKGRLVATELHSEILTSLLDKSLECALRYLDFKKRNIKVSSRVEKRDDGRYDVTCTFTEKKPGQGTERRVIFTTTLAVDSENRAERMKKNFIERPDVIYRGVIALLSGKC